MCVFNHCLCILIQQLPLVVLDNITTFFELSHLGMDTDTDTLFIHGDMVSNNTGMIISCSFFSHNICLELSDPILFIPGLPSDTCVKRDSSRSV